MRYLIAFLKRYYYFFLFVVLEIICVVLIANDSYYQGSVIINSTNQFTGKLFTTVNNVTEYFALKESNKILAEENAKFHSISGNAFIKVDTKTIFKNDTLYNQQFIYSAAKVISNSINKRNNFLMLNKGIRHGIKKDMAVISSQGIVGIVKDVSNNFSSVISVLHKDIKISAKIKKNNYIGTVVWGGNDYKIGSFEDIPNHVEIAKGDTVITSGYSKIFPEGVLVGTIEESGIYEGNNFYTISILFSTEFNKLAYVYIVENLKREEQLQLTETE